MVIVYKDISCIAFIKNKCIEVGNMAICETMRGTFPLEETIYK